MVGREEGPHGVTALAQDPVNLVKLFLPLFITIYCTQLLPVGSLTSMCGH
jgi:hypothetical protein